MVVSASTPEISAKQLNPTRYGYLRKLPTLSKLNKRKIHGLLITEKIGMIADYTQNGILSII